MRVFPHHPRHDGISLFLLVKQISWTYTPRRSESMPISLSFVNELKYVKSSVDKHDGIYKCATETDFQVSWRTASGRFWYAKKSCGISGAKKSSCRSQKSWLAIQSDAGKILILFWFFSSAQTFDVTILTPPKFVTETRSLTNLRSGTVNFTCNVTGNPQPEVEWWVV